MTILFLSRRFYPEIGGVEKHIYELSQELIRQGHAITVIAENHGSKDVEQRNGIKIIRVNAGNDDWFKKFRIWQQIWKHRKLIKKSDIIHCHDVFFWYLPFRFLYPKKPVFVTFHGYESYPILGKAKLQHWLAEKLTRGNICIGDFIKKWYGTKPTFVAYGGVDSNLFAERAYANRRVTPSTSSGKKMKESALFIGRLDAQTGILTYVKAYEILQKKHPKFVFTVVGDGEYRELIEKKVKVFGFQKDPEKYFQQHQFAFVSRYLSILEAFAARKLVFAVYDNPIKEDYLRMTPFAKFLIIENNPELLAKKIEYYLNHPQEEKKMISYAHKWVSNQTWEKMSKTYLNHWNKDYSGNILT